VQQRRRWQDAQRVAGGEREEEKREEKKRKKNLHARLDSHVEHVLLALDAEHFIDLKLDWHAVGVPAEVARHVEPSLVREARADVLDRAGQDMTCARDDDDTVGWLAEEERARRAERLGSARWCGTATVVAQFRCTALARWRARCGSARTVVRAARRERRAVIERVLGLALRLAELILECVDLVPELQRRLLCLGEGDSRGGCGADGGVRECRSMVAREHARALG
jgi:hypothetical protein